MLHMIISAAGILVIGDSGGRGYWCITLPLRFKVLDLWVHVQGKYYHYINMLYRSKETISKVLTKQ